MAQKEHSNFQNVLFAIGGGLLVAGSGYLIYNYFTDDSDSSLDLNPGNKLSYNENWYKVQADALQQHLWAQCLLIFGCEDDVAAGNILKMLNTDADYYKLILVYGERDSPDPSVAWMYNEMTLVETVAKYLDASIIDQINNDWLAKGMTVQLSHD